MKQTENVKIYHSMILLMVNCNKKYDTIIYCFALHLLEESKLPIFLYKLTQISNQLLIISPHKKPIIKNEWGWLIQDETIIDKVRIRLYKNIFSKHL